MDLLLINSDFNLKKLLTYHLEKKGFSIESRDSLLDSLEIINSKSFKVIVIDLIDQNNLDEKNLNILKLKNPDVIIIITVEFGKVDLAIKACKMGADDYLTKPVGAEQIQFTIEKIQKIKKLKNENKYLKQKLNNSN